MALYRRLKKTDKNSPVIMVLKCRGLNGHDDRDSVLSYGSEYWFSIIYLFIWHFARVCIWNSPSKKEERSTVWFKLHHEHNVKNRAILRAVACAFFVFFVTLTWIKSNGCQYKFSSRLFYALHFSRYFQITCVFLEQQLHKKVNYLKIH